MPNLKIADQSASTRLNYCPHCGHKLDAAEHVSEQGEFLAPHPGSATVCGYCGGWLVFTADMTVRKMDAMDIRDMDAETHMMLIAITNAVQAVQKKMHGRS